VGEAAVKLGFIMWFTIYHAGQAYVFAWLAAIEDFGCPKDLPSPTSGAK